MGFKIPILQVRLPKWYDSIRSLATFLLIVTYCVILVGTTISACRLLSGESTSALGEKLVLFVISNISGVAIGGLMTYHFKKPEENGEGAQK